MLLYAVFSCDGAPHVVMEMAVRALRRRVDVGKMTKASAFKTLQWHQARAKHTTTP